VEETLNALRRHGNFVSDDICHNAFGTFAVAHAAGAGDSDSVMNSRATARLDMEQFCEFVRILEEHMDRAQLEEFAGVAREHNLSPKEEEIWRHDLVDFHRMFHEYDPCSGCYGSSTGSLDEAQVIVVLRESGYMPKTRQKQNALVEVLQKVKRQDATIGFTEFLSVVHRLREMDRERLRRIVDTRVPDRSGVVATSDVTELLHDCGIEPRNPAEHGEIAALVEDFQETGSGALAREEVVVLCQRIAAKLRVMRHERERQYVLSVGWTEQHFCEFRTAFQVFDEDMSEVLERDELMKAVELLKGHYWQSTQNINLMFVALGIDPNKEIRVNFLTFLRLLKMLDESEARRQQGAAAGFGRERTDKLFSCFQALEPESNGTVHRDTLARAVTGATARWIAKVQIDEVHRALGQEPMQVEFAGFLRSMKVVEALVEADLEECIDDMIGWQQVHAAHEKDEARRPSLLRLIRQDSATGG